MIVVTVMNDERDKRLLSWVTAQNHKCILLINLFLEIPFSLNHFTEILFPENYLPENQFPDCLIHEINILND